MRRILLSLLLSLVLTFIPVSVAMAATSDTVTVTATPSYVSISNAPATWAVGLVTASTNSTTGAEYFTCTNNSTVNIGVFVYSENWSGTTAWTYGYSAADTGQLWASDNDAAYDLLIPGGDDASSNVTLRTTTLAGEDITWEMQLETPSSFTHGEVQTANVTLEAYAS